MYLVTAHSVIRQIHGVRARLAISVMTKPSNVELDVKITAFEIQCEEQGNILRFELVFRVALLGFLGFEGSKLVRFSWIRDEFEG